jgi:orotate phosphoribosyltransferase
MKKNEVINEFRDAGALLEGHFILSSGLHSSKYLQCALALSEPSRAHRLSFALGEKISKEIKTRIDLVYRQLWGVSVLGMKLQDTSMFPLFF